MRKPVLVVCVAAAIGLAGCSASTPGTATPGAVAPGAATPGTTSAAVAPATYATAADLATGLSGATQRKGSAKVAFTFGVGGQSITGTGAYAGTGADTKLQMSMNAGGQGDVELVLLGRTVYVKVPDSPGAKPWIRSSLDSDLGKQFGGLGDQADLGKQFEQLKSAGTLTGSAPDTVDGTPATRYALTLDAAELAASGTPEQQQALARSGVRTIDTQIWVGADDLPLRVTTTVPVQGQNTTVDMRYSEWGLPVDIAAPPADQVTDAPN